MRIGCHPRRPELIVLEFQSTYFNPLFHLLIDSHMKIKGYAMRYLDIAVSSERKGSSSERSFQFIMKRPPDPSQLPPSFLSPPVSPRSTAYPYRPWLSDPFSQRISPLRPIACPQVEILFRILRWCVGLGFDYVKLYCRVPRSVRVWPRSSPIWQPLVSTVHRHMLHVPAHDDPLNSARPQLCVVVCSDLQILTRYYLSLLSNFHEFY